MPTGLTAPIYEGKPITFAQFALRCARQMGACIMQRDDPSDDLPKLREMSAHYATRLAEAEVRIAELQALNPDQAEWQADEAFRRKQAEEATYAASRNAVRARYEAMLSAVRQWNPPTAQHMGLKELMEKQLRDSLDFDCGDYSTTPPRLTGREWLEQEMEKARRDVACYGQQVAEERSRVESANRWITALYDNLGIPVPG